MPIDPAPPALRDFITQVYLRYAALMRSADSPEPYNLGGNLLYAGELDALGRLLAIAGNVAGAATLAATANKEASKQAMREGVVDFAVTTLDEALRILKNQVRKHEPVSVCVGAPPEEIEREMFERGVKPDLLAPVNDAQSGSLARFMAQGARSIVLEPLASGQMLFNVEIPSSLIRRTAEIDEVLGASLAAEDDINRRWLRLSPRYLGPGARRIRSLVCDAKAAEAARLQLGRVMSSR